MIEKRKREGEEVREKGREDDGREGGEEICILEEREDS